MKGEKSMVNSENKMGWNFDNSYVRLPETYFVRQKPTPVPAPQLMMLNKALANSLGLSADALGSEEGIAILAGNQIPKGAEPLSQAYAGHQFGFFTMLGDGRAVLLGEQITPSGERLDIQYKGSGRTPFSRGGDGRATLGPMLREFIMSEAMHALGIPTSRSLAVVKTGESVIRETELPGAVLTRVSSSHLRVGTFEYARQWSSLEEFKNLIDYTIERHYPDIKDDPNRFLSLYHRVIDRQAALIAKWQLVGFIHGVMNTDNMTISGETIDYGPCAFMDQYDPETVFSSIDTGGRYAYGNQPAIGQWNLSRLAGTLLPFFDEDKEKAIQSAKEGLVYYAKRYDHYWLEGMRAKLGLIKAENGDKSFINKLLNLMKEHEADFTNTFRDLTQGVLTGSKLYESPDFKEWHSSWQSRISKQAVSKSEVEQLMRKSNPSMIPRNHRVEEALEAAVEYGDYSVAEKLLQLLNKPFAYTEEQFKFNTLPEPSACPYQTYCGT